MFQFFRKQFDPNSAPGDMPGEGLSGFWYLLRTYSLQLIGLNLLTLILCLPLVTAPAALCAMNRVCGLLIRKGYVSLTDSYFREFKSSFFRAFLLGALYTGFFLSGFICILYSIAMDGEPLARASLIFGILEICLTLLLYGWSFVLLSVQDLSPGKLLRNTVAMIFLEPACDLKILLITGAAAAVVWFAFPFSLFALLLLPCLTQLAVCYVTQEPITRRISQAA